MLLNNFELFKRTSKRSISNLIDPEKPLEIPEKAKREAQIIIS